MSKVATFSLLVVTSSVVSAVMIYVALLPVKAELGHRQRIVVFDSSKIIQAVGPETSNEVLQSTVAAIKQREDAYAEAGYLVIDSGAVRAGGEQYALPLDDLVPQLRLPWRPLGKFGP